jgi:Ser/Thr protein kinase RdoA (MazF antagonist)
MEAVMERQPHVPPARLDRAELARIADGIGQAVTQAEALPSSLVHADLNPGNIFVDPSGCRFLDWAEASVAHPFVALDNLLGHLHKQEATDPHALAQVRQAYAAEWETQYDEAAVRRTLRVTRLLRLATMAWRSAGWLRGRPTSLQEERLLRSLCRSILEEMRALSRQEVSA